MGSVYIGVIICNSNIRRCSVEFRIFFIILHSYLKVPNLSLSEVRFYKFREVMFNSIS